MPTYLEGSLIGYLKASVRTADVAVAISPVSPGKRKSRIKIEPSINIDGLRDTATMKRDTQGSTFNMHEGQKKREKLQIRGPM